MSSTANGINDSGTIVGFYTNTNDSVIGFVTTTVPEPATWALFGFGFAGVALLGSRSRGAKPGSTVARTIG